MIETIIAGVLLTLAFCCIVLPALAALGGPDEDESPNRSREGR